MDGDSGMKTFGNRILNGVKSVGVWFSTTAVVSGIPLLFYVILSLVFGFDRKNGLAELAVYFFGIGAPIMFDVKTKQKDNGLLNAVKNVLTFSFILCCLCFATIYILDFVKYSPSSEELNTILYLIVIFGGGCFILTAVTQFFGGYYAE